MVTQHLHTASKLTSLEGEVVGARRAAGIAENIYTRFMYAPIHGKSIWVLTTETKTIYPLI